MSKASEKIKADVDKFWHNKLGSKSFNRPTLPEVEKKKETQPSDSEKTAYSDDYYTIIKLLPLGAQSIYGYLYRESHGRKSNSCFLGYRDMMSVLCIATKKTVAAHIKLLIKMKYIREIDRYNDSKIQGTKYWVYSPKEIIDYYLRENISFEDSENAQAKIEKLLPAEFPEKISIETTLRAESKGIPREDRLKIREIFCRKFPKNDISEQAIESLIEKHSCSTESLITFIKRMKKGLANPDKYFIETLAKEHGIKEQKKKYTAKKRNITEPKKDEKTGALAPAKENIKIEKDATDIMIENLPEIDRNRLRIEARNEILIQNKDKDKEILEREYLSETTIKGKMKELFLEGQKGG